MDADELRIVAIMTGLPIAIVTSYFLYQRGQSVRTSDTLTAHTRGQLSKGKKLRNYRA